MSESTNKFKDADRSESIKELLATTSNNSIPAAWDSCESGPSLLHFAETHIGHYGITHEAVALATCLCVEEALGYVPKNEERPREALRAIRVEIADSTEETREERDYTAERVKAYALAAGMAGEMDVAKAAFAVWHLSKNEFSYAAMLCGVAAGWHYANYREGTGTPYRDIPEGKARETMAQIVRDIIKPQFGPSL